MDTRLSDLLCLELVGAGLVVVGAEAMGSDIEEYGRVVLDGIVFEFDKARLMPESKAALDAIARYLRTNPDKSFYVVGHTDSKGTFEYNSKLASDRARTVAKIAPSVVYLRFGTAIVALISPKQWCCSARCCTGIGKI